MKMRAPSTVYGLLLLLTSFPAVHVQSQETEPQSHLRSSSGTVTVASTTTAEEPNTTKNRPLTSQQNGGYSNIEPLQERPNNSHTLVTRDAAKPVRVHANEQQQEEEPRMRSHSELNSLLASRGSNRHHQGLPPATTTTTRSTTTSSSSQLPPKPPKKGYNDDDDDSSKRRLGGAGQQRKLSGCAGKYMIVTCRLESEEDCHAELEQNGVQVTNTMDCSRYFQVCVDSDEDIAVLKDLVFVDDVEQDPIRTLSYLPERTKPHRKLQSQLTPYGVLMVQAEAFWDRYGKKGEDITVCVIDTGLYANHEDLEDADTTGSNNRNLMTPWDQDGNSHGTHVAGTVAAVDNNRGVVGVAPKATLAIARVFDNDGDFTASSLVAAMRICQQELNANIISMSLGGPVASSAERSTIAQLTADGIVVVAASGNDGNGLNVVEYPSSYPSVVGVGAVSESGLLAGFSGNNEFVDVVAPGVDVLSTTSNGGYSEYSGTSMATPHVAGVAALLMGQFPSKSQEQIVNAMKFSARDMGACGYDRMYGHGIVNAMAAAQYLEDGTEAFENNDCVPVQLTFQTDMYGAENFFDVIATSNRVNGGEHTIYRAGIFESGEIVKHEYDIELRPGCYRFRVFDRYGDGITSDNPDFGQGYFEVVYDGVRQVYNDQFRGGQETYLFGTCGEEEPQDPVCGNGVVEEGEECDDGDNDNQDECTNDCKVTFCGDNDVQNGEECDDGNQDNTDSCTTDCTNARCGDGYIQDGEECDEGDENGGAKCTDDCELVEDPPADPECGNGIVEVGEDCDDGDNDNTDGCTNDCKFPSCGDGFIQGNEECDNGPNNSNNGSCTEDCKNARCGDGFVQGEEECDEGDANNGGDTCASNCQLAYCGDGIVQGDEECDDGDQDNTDFCTTECKFAVCGDGYLQDGEECDDGNVKDTDGCSSDCKIEVPETPGRCPSGEVPVDLDLDTDRYAWSENELYFFDDSTEDYEWIWIATKRGIRSNHQYQLSTCVRPTSCYKFFFFDTYGDGLFDGGLDLKYNEQSVLRIAPYEIGDPWQGSRDTVYWTRLMGTCADDA